MSDLINISFYTGEIRFEYNFESFSEPKSSESITVDNINYDFNCSDSDKALLLNLVPEILFGENITKACLEERLRFWGAKEIRILTECKTIQENKIEHQIRKSILSDSLVSPSSYNYEKLDPIEHPPLIYLKNYFITVNEINAKPNKEISKDDYVKLSCQYTAFHECISQCHELLNDLAELKSDHSSIKNFESELKLFLDALQKDKEELQSASTRAFFKINAAFALNTKTQKASQMADHLFQHAFSNSAFTNETKIDVRCQLKDKNWVPLKFCEDEFRPQIYRKLEFRLTDKKNEKEITINLNPKPLKSLDCQSLFPQIFSEYWSKVYLSMMTTLSSSEFSQNDINTLCFLLKRLRFVFKSDTVDQGVFEEIEKKKQQLYEAMIRHELDSAFICPYHETNKHYNNIEILERSLEESSGISFDYLIRPNKEKTMGVILGKIADQYAVLINYIRKKNTQDITSTEIKVFIDILKFLADKNLTLSGVSYLSRENIVLKKIIEREEQLQSSIFQIFDKEHAANLEILRKFLEINEKKNFSFTIGENDPFEALENYVLAIKACPLNEKPTKELAEALIASHQELDKIIKLALAEKKKSGEDSKSNPALTKRVKAIDQFLSLVSKENKILLIRKKMICDYLIEMETKEMKNSHTRNAFVHHRMNHRVITKIVKNEIEPLYQPSENYWYERELLSNSFIAKYLKSLPLFVTFPNEVEKALHFLDSNKKEELLGFKSIEKNFIEKQNTNYQKANCYNYLFNYETGYRVLNEEGPYYPSGEGGIKGLESSVAYQRMSIYRNRQKLLDVLASVPFEDLCLRRDLNVNQLRQKVDLEAKFKKLEMDKTELDEMMKNNHKKLFDLMWDKQFLWMLKEMALGSNASFSDQEFWRFILWFSSSEERLSAVEQLRNKLSHILNDSPEKKRLFELISKRWETEQSKAHEPYYFNYEEEYLNIFKYIEKHLPEIKEQEKKEVARLASLNPRELFKFLPVKSYIEKEERKIIDKEKIYGIDNLILEGKELRKKSYFLKRDMVKIKTKLLPFLAWKDGSRESENPDPLQFEFNT